MVKTIDDGIVDSTKHGSVVITTVGSRHPCGPIFSPFDSTFRYAGVYTAVCRGGSRDDIVLKWLGTLHAPSFEHPHQYIGSTVVLHRAGDHLPATFFLVVQATRKSCIATKVMAGRI